MSESLCLDVDISIDVRQLEHEHTIVVHLVIVPMHTCVNLYGVLVGWKQKRGRLISVKRSVHIDRYIDTDIGRCRSQPTSNGKPSHQRPSIHYLSPRLPSSSVPARLSSSTCRNRRRKGAVERVIEYCIGTLDVRWRTHADADGQDDNTTTAHDTRAA